LTYTGNEGVFIAIFVQVSPGYGRIDKWAIPGKGVVGIV
jgi:hypothetical protein